MELSRQTKSFSGVTGTAVFTIITAIIVILLTRQFSQTSGISISPFGPDTSLAQSAPRSAVCSGLTVSSQSLNSSSGNFLTFTLTGTPPASSISYFMLAFYNLDNLFSPGNPKPVYFSGIHYHRTDCIKNNNTCTFTIKYDDLFRPDENFGSQFPMRIQVNGYFGLTDGSFSLADPKCVRSFSILPSVVFPKDHAAHPGYSNEWWYLNLLVRTVEINGSNQKDLGYLISFSRIFGTNGLLSSRFDNTTKSFAQATAGGGKLSVNLINNLLQVNYSGSVYMVLKEQTPLANGAKQFTLTGTTPQMGTLNLVLKERTVKSGGNTPLLWGCTGRISVFNPLDTLYYSMPDLDITGTITDVNKVTRKVVAGKAWFDHQWFSSLPASDWKGHYWSSFHYTTGSSVYDSGAHAAAAFVTQIFTSGPRYNYWVKRNFNGSSFCGGGGEVAINSYSPGGYPTNWLFKFDQLGLGNPQGIAFSSNQVYTVGPKSFFEPSAYFSGITNAGYTGLGFLETGIKN
ncbi:MAG: hypothetical protein UX91_C0001G0057 [Candidatus Amesbacteria bacterium GW2011_GWB1_47_19]|nr:MAG: hypothetical protein UW51_C0001G0057 [Candidatus Amesbacteria bacterium GW2011_GWA1_44_24]KKU32069.1 MAG: hypothetical protein UX46_C0001G0056 [Candidatus Amesbacteria bacterium GW2011_GWC1_46_24]KKU67753.1 MAG: hypothetical protein UX91_C0001G0057 [Candidatus Amesbacteria bacterium GW2011_GWB1_47_19]OGD06062.1 MAG: hypothetical protein A2379_03140 [Candidatus Amesbacteria bacterium RIFOXYB1_FULL_47_13]